MSFTAGKLRVLIATTNGPVEIQLLTEEDAAIGRCVACIGGTTETADIASAYHAFVVRPTGVIEGRYGHSCYRLDVSARIDAGSSWQLGVLAAHALLAAGRLAQENNEADAILWVTGSVRPVDLTVGGVSHVPEKLANSLERLKQERIAGRPVVLAVPTANAADASPSATKELLEIGAELVTVSDAQALFYFLGLKLPAVRSKGSTPAPSEVALPKEGVPAKAQQAVFDEPLQQRPVSTKPRRRVYAWAAGAAAIGIVAVGTIVFTGIPRTVVPRSDRPQAANAAAAPAAGSPSVATASNQPPRNPGPRGPELVPDKIPFIKSNDRQRVRDEYMPASNYKALAMNMYESHFVSGLSSQEAADKAAVETCESTKRRPSTESSVSEIEYRCELFASGTIVVTQHSNIPMPPVPWVNPSVQRPFVASEIPLSSKDSQELADRRYRRNQRSKAMVIAPNGRYFTTSAESSAEEAMRRTLERCGYISKAACLVIAVDDTFVNAVPTLGKAVGFYRPDALFGVPNEERAEIARRLASSSSGWHAVALGATQHVGTKVGAITERSAVDGALENCALYDRDCRIAVIGPFLVQPAPASPLAPEASSAPPAPPASSSGVDPVPGAPTPSVRPTRQTTYER